MIIAILFRRILCLIYFSKKCLCWEASFSWKKNYFDEYQNVKTKFEQCLQFTSLLNFVILFFALMSALRIRSLSSLRA